MAPHSEIVLLTGADGFTGRHLATRLRAEGMRVFGATRHPSDAEDVKMDLSDGASVAAAVAEVSPDVVVHLAGIATALHANVAEIYAVNTVGTANLLSALAASPKLPRRVIIASSATVYAPPSDDTPITEDHPRRPAHHYGASKLAVEEIARLYSQKLPVIVTRPFNYTGVGQTGDFIVRKIIRHFQEGAAEIRLGELQLERDFSDVEDVVEAYVRLTRVSTDYAVVNLCSGNVVHLADIVPMLVEITGQSMTVIRDERFVRGGEPQVIRGSTERLNTLIGTFPRRPFRLTLERMVGA
jgi:nucleoside-diphosphate-sugar epimerase